MKHALYASDRMVSIATSGSSSMKRLRVEPYASYLERRRKGPIYPVTIEIDCVAVGEE
jgi:hypothetical protein